MVDYALITSTISSIKAATDIATLIKERGLSLEEAEIKLKIADLINSLADAKINLAEICQLILEKDNKTNELNSKLEIKEKLYYDGQFYWLQDSESKDGPYCQPCYDKNSKLIRLQPLTKGQWQCLVCRNIFYTKDYKSPDYNSLIYRDRGD
jgi:hypothetical protein